MAYYFGYKSKGTAFNGLALKMQDYIRIPKSTATYHYDMTREFNKIFCDFLRSVGSIYSEGKCGWDKNAQAISRQYYSQFIAWFKENHERYKPKR